jgi:hypothetical protein
MTKNYEFFDWHIEQGNTLLAAVVAVQVASGKASRAGRSAWLEEAKKLMPAWEAAIREADRYGQWERLDALVDAALKTAGLTRQDAWNIH